LRSTSWAARRNAAWALGAFDDPRAVTALIDALKDREPAVREQVAWALGALDDKRAVQVLVGALKDTDPRVRRQAAWALGAIDDVSAAAALTSAWLTTTTAPANRRHGRSARLTTAVLCRPCCVR